MWTIKALMYVHIQALFFYPGIERKYTQMAPIHYGRTCLGDETLLMLLFWYEPLTIKINHAT